MYIQPDFLKNVTARRTFFFQRFFFVCLFVVLFSATKQSNVAIIKTKTATIAFSLFCSFPFSSLLRFWRSPGSRNKPLTPFHSNDCNFRCVVRPMSFLSRRSYILAFIQKRFSSNLGRIVIQGHPDNYCTLSVFKGFYFLPLSVTSHHTVTNCLPSEDNIRQMLQYSIQIQWSDVQVLHFCQSQQTLVLFGSCV